MDFPGHNLSTGEDSAGAPGPAAPGPDAREAAPHYVDRHYGGVSLHSTTV